MFGSGVQMLNLYGPDRILKNSIETHPWFVKDIFWEGELVYITVVCVHKECDCDGSKKRLGAIAVIDEYATKWSFSMPGSSGKLSNNSSLDRMLSFLFVEGM